MRHDYRKWDVAERIGAVPETEAGPFAEVTVLADGSVGLFTEDNDGDQAGIVLTATDARVLSAYLIRAAGRTEP